MFNLKVLLFFTLCTSVNALRTQAGILEDFFAPKRLTIEDGLKTYIDRRVKRVHINAYFQNYTRWRFEFADAQSAFLRKSGQLSYLINVQHGELERPHRHNLCYVDSLKSFQRILPKAREHFGSTTEFYIIILKLPKTTKYFGLIQQMLKILYNRNVINAIAIVEDPLITGDYLVYTHKIFKAKFCRSTELAIVNTFRNGKFEHDELFPKKLGNLERCPLYITSHNFQPFFMYDKYQQTMTGVEANILNVIAEQMNFSVNIVANEERTFGDVHENGSSSGGFLDLQRRKADIFVGSEPYIANRGRYFAHSSTYLPNRLVVVRLRSDYLKKIGETFLWPMQPFCNLLWIFIISLFAIGIVLMNVVKFMPKYRLHSDLQSCSWLRVFGSMLGGVSGSTRLKGLSSPLRCSLVLWCIVFSILHAAYQARLYVTRNQKFINTNWTTEDLVAAKYRFLLKDSTTNNFLKNTLGISNEHIYDIDVDDPILVYETLLNSTGKMAAVAIERHLIHYIRTKHLYDVFDISPNSLNTFSTCMYFQPNSFLVEPFNEILKQLMSSGLIINWLNEVEFKLKFLESRRTFTYCEAAGLNIALFYPIFIAMAISYSIAIIVFLIELRFK